jgi:hypothetical protein
MAGSIEFGVLEEWSTTSFVRGLRVDVDENEFTILRPALDRVTRRTGIEFDTYSSATLGGSELEVFIEEIAREAGKFSTMKPLLENLLRCARHAQQTSRSLQYRGL